MRIVSLGLQQTSLWLGFTAAVLEAIRFVCTVTYYVSVSLYQQINNPGIGVNLSHQTFVTFFNFHYLAGAIVGMTATFIGSFIVILVFNLIAKNMGGIPVGVEHPLDIQEQQL